MRDDPFLYTIYDHPSDYPEHFVARRWSLVGNQDPARPDPGPVVAIGLTLDEVRGLLPRGLTCIGRDAGDDPVIVETWL